MPRKKILQRKDHRVEYNGTKYEPGPLTCASVGKNFRKKFTDDNGKIHSAHCVKKRVKKPRNFQSAVEKQKKGDFNLGVSMDEYEGNSAAPKAKHGYYLSALTEERQKELEDKYIKGRSLGANKKAASPALTWINAEAKKLYANKTLRSKGLTWHSAIANASIKYRKEHPKKGK